MKKIKDHIGALKSTRDHYQTEIYVIVTFTTTKGLIYKDRDLASRILKKKEDCFFSRMIIKCLMEQNHATITEKP